MQEDGKSNAGMSSRNGNAEPVLTWNVTGEDEDDCDLSSLHGLSSPSVGDNHIVERIAFLERNSRKMKKNPEKDEKIQQEKREKEIHKGRRPTPRSWKENISQAQWNITVSHTSYQGSNSHPGGNSLVKDTLVWEFWGLCAR